VTIRDANHDVVAKAVSSQLSMDIVGSIGLSKRISVGAHIPTVLYQRSDDNEAVASAVNDARAPTNLLQPFQSPPQQAFGDIGITGKLTLLTYDEMGGLGLAAYGKVTAPTGKSNSFIAEGAPTGEFRILADLNIIAATFRATVGYKYRAEHRVLAQHTIGNEIPWGLGITLFPRAIGIDAEGRWAWTIESYGSLPTAPDAPFTNAAITPAIVAASARYQFAKDFTMTAGAEIPVSHAWTTPIVRAIVGVSWAPRTEALNSEGIPTHVRKRGFLPEDDEDIDDLGDELGVEPGAVNEQDRAQETTPDTASDADSELPSVSTEDVD